MRIVISAGIIIAAAFTSYREIENVEITVKNQVLANSFAANRNVHILFDSARIALDTAAVYIDIVDGRIAPNERLNVALDAANKSQLFVIGIIVLDADGNAVATAHPRTGLGVSYAVANHFQALKNDPAKIFALGTPRYSQVFNQVLVPLARSIRDIDGTFLGVIAVGMSFSEIQNALKPASGIGDAKSRLWRDDGLLLASSENDQTEVGIFYPNIPLFRERDSNGDFGTFVAYSPLNNETRISAWRNNFSYPVFVSSGTNRAPAMRQVHNEVAFIAFAALSLLVLVWALAFMSDREIRRREKAIEELRASRREAKKTADDAKKSAIEAQRLAAVADAASRAKTLMLARFSHEFRTPLNAVIGFSEMTRLGYGGPISDRARENLGIVHSAGEHLNRMIGTLLDLSRIELSQSALDKERYDLKHALQDAVSMVQADAMAKSVQIKVEAPEGGFAADCDPMRIVQVLVNLMSNAIRHSPSGGSVVVSLGAEEHGAVFRVEDRGEGIQANRLSSIFEPFGGEHPDAVRPEGTGLGLAISRQIMVAHGGNLTIENREGGGCCATATLPVSNDHDAKEVEPVGVDVAH